MTQIMKKRYPSQVNWNTQAIVLKSRNEISYKWITYAKSKHKKRSQIRSRYVTSAFQLGDERHLRKIMPTELRNNDRGSPIPNFRIHRRCNRTSRIPRRTTNDDVRNRRLSIWRMPRNINWKNLSNMLS